MAIYAIGDVQGCYVELRQLLDRIRFDPAHDQLWFTGDLVNRGPHSLDTLRYIRNLGPAARSVLGNHDLHLLAVACGASRTKRRDTFGDILGAPDRDELLDWLRQLPLIHHDHEFYMLHAGLPPQWDMNQAVAYAEEVHAILRGNYSSAYFAHMYGDEPSTWSERLAGWERLRFITSVFTRTRYCDRTGHLNFKEKARPGEQPKGLIPWFDAPGRRSHGANIVFGHWSTLGFYAAGNCWCLDTGCLWGGELTALRLDIEPKSRISVPCTTNGHQQPKI